MSGLCGCIPSIFRRVARHSNDRCHWTYTRLPYAASMLESILSKRIAILLATTFAPLAAVAGGIPDDRAGGSRREWPARAFARRASVRKPGCGHRRTARLASGVAHGRVDGSRAGTHRHAAQRRRQSEPVLPARLQPRSRHGSRDQRRWRAREHADARPWPGLHGHQFRDSGAGASRSNIARAPTTPRPATSPRRARSTCAIAASSMDRWSCSKAARTTTSRGLLAGFAGARRRQRCCSVSTTRRSTVRGCSRRTIDKRNGLLRYSRETARKRQFSITAQGYEGEWRSTDQIPLRAVQSGQIDRFGFVDPTDGGASHRYSLSADWSARSVGGRQSHALALCSRLRSRSDLEFLLLHRSGQRRSVPAGRRSAHLRRRLVVARGRSTGRTASRSSSTGVQVRHDDIGKVGLVSHDRARTLRDGSRRCGATRRATPLLEHRHALERQACARRSACAPTVSISTSTPASQRIPGAQAIRS